VAVSKRLRFEILRRDDHACRYCGAKAPDVRLTVDHVGPTALGGSDDPSNLVTACAPCNSGKSATPADAAIVADVQADALRWARALDEVRRRAIADHHQMTNWQTCFQENWNRFTSITPTYRGGSGKPETEPLPVDWRPAISGLAADGMYPREMLEAIEITMGRNPGEPFAYFIGIIRNKLRDRQEAARALLDSGEF
jgi:hypothetical protein